MKKQYYFARLFARSAKSIAVFVIFFGIGFCVLRYYQASIAAGGAAYHSSPELQKALDELKDEFLSTEQFVDSFNAGSQSSTPSLQGPGFPLIIESGDEFARTAAELSKLDRERQQLKESVVGRFESLVKGIEEKLHAYAAALQPPAPNASPVADVGSSVSPEPPAAGPDESLFSPKLNSSEVHERSQTLSERKDFLKALATKAENAENQAILVEAANQVERLAKLLPENSDASAVARLDSASTAANESKTDPSSKVPPSERAARQLEQLRNNVRQMLLTSWTLDDVFDRAAGVLSAEREKERTASLTQKGIWLSAAPRIGIGLLAAGLCGLLILVFGDLVQTQLDTASNSTLVAEAINSLRGSVTHLSEPTSIIAPTPMTTSVEEDWPAAGGS